MNRAGYFLIVAALAGTLIVPILLGGKASLLAAFTLQPEQYLAVFLTIAASWMFRAIKLRLLLRRLDVLIGRLQALGISLATDFGFLATPGGVGGYAASVYYFRRAGASISGAATLTAVDQGLDLFFFSLSLPIAGLTMYGSDLPSAIIAIAVTSSAVMVSVALVALLGRKTLLAWLFSENYLVRRWPRLRASREKFRVALQKLNAHWRVLLAGGPSFLSALVALTALQWITRYGVLWLVLLLIGHPVSFALTLLLQALVLHAAQFTGVPAGGGGAELGLSATLAGLVPTASLATALLLWRVATLYLCLIAGGVAIAALARHKSVQVHNVDKTSAEECAKLHLDTP